MSTLLEDNRTNL